MALALIEACVERGVPLFGICRGLQEMNVAFGGSLHPEIRELPGRMNHRMPRLENGEIHPDPTVVFADRHEVQLAPDGAFAKLLGCETIRVNSLHGQGILEPGKRVVVEGIAEDGTIEAIRIADAPAFALGVQWHAEYDPQTNPINKALFEAFGAALVAAQRRSRHDAADAPQPVHPQPRPSRGVVAASGGVAAAADRHPLLPGPGAARRGGRCSNSIFLADQLALGDDVAQRRRAPGWSRSPCWRRWRRRPSRIGLIATASTTYTEPFNLARQFASIDHISNGRAGWNIVTSWLATAAAQLRRRRPGEPCRPLRPRRGVHAAWSTALWDSWADDAVLDDRAGGHYARPDRIRPINHDGEHYKVAGPLNMPRCPQGRPVFVQAGSSDTGRRFAARHAEAVFTAQMEKATAQDFYADLKALAAAEGRRRRPGADPAGPEPDDRRHRSRGAAPWRAS